MNRRFFSQLWEYLRRRWINVRRIRFWVLVAVGLYTLTGFLLVPWLAGEIAVDTAREDFGRELRIGNVDFNPYTFTLEVSELTLADPDGHQLVAFDRLLINFTLVSVIDQAWTFQEVRLEGPVVQEERFGSGETRITRLIENAVGAPTEQEAAGEATDGGMPAVVIRDLDVAKGVIRFVDHLSPEPEPSGTTATIVVRALELSLDDAALHESTGFPVRLAGQLDAGGAISFDGDVRVSPSFAVDGDLQVETLALSPAEPYLQQLARVAFGGGSVSLGGRLSIGGDELLVWRGSADIDELSLVPLDGEEPVAGWQALHIEQLDVSLGQRSVEASRVSIRGASGRVVIREDQSTNIGRLLVEGAVDKESTDEEDADDPGPPLRISIAGIVLADGGLRFADRSLPLPFSTRIRELNGEISALASNTQAPANVRLEGQVGDHGLARIEGAIHAWQPMRDTNVTLTFRNLQVPEYSPYTVAFAGRRIAGGRMDLDLGYHFADGQLEGRNKIALHDLELGEKVESPGAMDLPLGLAVALLKNSEGVIEMEIPVTGDAGDPQFELGGAIRKAVTGAIAKVISSPFRFLGRLFGGGDEDLGRIVFPAGRSDLTPPQRERVALLRKALANRPELVLELPGPFDPEVDGPVLRRLSAVEQLAARLSEQGREVSTPDLTAESTQEAMEAMFSSAYPDTSLDDVRERFMRAAEEVPEGHSRLDAVAYRAHLAERVIAAQPVTGSDFALLAHARASAVRDHLLAPREGAKEATAVEFERVLLAEPAAVESENGQVVMEVGLAVN